MDAEVEEPSMMNFPSEILVKIFDYLSYADIKCVRLVCNRWLNVADGANFFPKAILTLTKSNYRNILNPPVINRLIETKKFKNVHFLEIEVNVAEEICKNYGKHIKSLTLEKGNGLLILCQISQYLDNLEYLTISQGVMKCLINTLDLSKLSKLRSITVYYKFRNSNQIIYDWVRTIKSPLEEISAAYDNGNLADLMQLLQQHRSSLKKVSLNSISENYADLNEYTEVFTQMPCLTKLALQSCCTTSREDSTDIFKNANGNLVTLRTLLLGDVYSLANDELKIISSACPNLQNLQINDCSDLGSIPAIGKLTQLKFLNLSMVANDFLDDGNIADTCLQIFDAIISVDRSCLRELSLVCFDLNEACVMQLAQNIPQLQTLRLSGCQKGVTNTSLQSIFQYLTNLKVLNVEGCTKISDDGLLGKPTGYSIMRLSGLQSLVLQGCKRLTNKSLSQLQFRELKYLDIRRCKTTLITLRALAKNCTALEELIISKQNSKAIKRILKKFKRLRHFNRLQESLSYCAYAEFSQLTEKERKELYQEEYSEGELFNSDPWYDFFDDDYDSDDDDDYSYDGYDSDYFNFNPDRYYFGDFF